MEMYSGTTGIAALDYVFVCASSDDPEQMASLMAEAVAPGDVILVKASRGVKAERVLESFKKKYPSKKK